MKSVAPFHGVLAVGFHGCTPSGIRQEGTLDMVDIRSVDLGILGKIDHFVVLMLENRSFDHMCWEPSRRKAPLLA